jgi:hypothetical protein
MEKFLYRILCHILFLSLSLLPKKTISQIQSNMNFVCQGNFIEIEGKKYYDGETAFLCEGNLISYSSELIAKHADGTEFPSNTEWEGVGNQTGSTVFVSSGNVSPNIDGKEVKAYYGSTSIAINIVFVRVMFTENAGQTYGYDPNGEKEEHYPSFSLDYSWKSVEIGQTDIINAEMAPTGLYEHVTFVSSDPVYFPVSPTNPTSDNQVLSLGANVSGHATVKSRINKTEGCNHVGFKSQVNIAGYSKKTKLVKFILIEEENDDEQLIEVGKGKAHSIAIMPGADGTLETVPNNTPNGGDDEISGNTITTGENGICETISLSSDVEIIEKGKGKPYQICIGAGQNNFRDTPSTEGDDEIDGDQINTGEDGICNSKALDENTNYMESSSQDPEALLTYVNSIYKQAVFEWENFTPIISTEVINYDLNRDEKLQIAVGGYSNSEINEIIAKCSSCVPMHHNVILVDRSNSDDAPGFSLRPELGKPYCFATVAATDQDYYQKTIAHELGHLGFGLQHPFEEFYPNYANPQFGILTYDLENLMDYGVAPEYKLRKYQWDQIHDQ